MGKGMGMGGGGGGGQAYQPDPVEKVEQGGVQRKDPDGTFKPVTSSRTHFGKLVPVDDQAQQSAGIFGAATNNSTITGLSGRASFAGGGQARTLGPRFTNSSSSHISASTATSSVGQQISGSLAFTPARQSSGAGMGAGTGGTGM